MNSAHSSAAKPHSTGAKAPLRSQRQKRYGKCDSIGSVGGPRIALAKTLRKLARLGWVNEGSGRYLSPETKLTYSFEEACRIADIPVPAKKPGNALWEWLRS